MGQDLATKQIISNVEHLFMCLLAICVSFFFFFLRNVCLGLLPIFFSFLLFFFFFFFSSCPFFNWVVSLLLYELFIFFEISHLTVTSFANIFLHFVGCLFILFMVSFAMQKLVSLIRSHLLIFAFISIALRD